MTRYHASWVLPISSPPLRNGTVVEQDGRGLLFGLLAHVKPEVVEKVHVNAQLFFSLAFCRGATNEAPGDALTVCLQHTLEALPFFIGRNFAGDAHMLNGGHVDNKAARQGDM